MPLVKKQNNKITKENVATNSDLEDQKNPGMSFSTNGLNDESITGATSIPVTDKEKATLTSDTAKLDKKAEKEYAVQVSKHVETYGLVPPTTEEYCEGQEEVANFCKTKIWTAVVEHKWYAFFTKLVDGRRVADQQKLQDYVNVATRHSYKLLVELYGYGSLDVATNLCPRALVDSLLIGDNSGSMMDKDASRHGDECITRWDYLKLVSQDDGFIAAMFDDDGYELILMTPDPRLRNICTNTVSGGKMTYMLQDPKNPDKCATLYGDNSGFKGLTSQEQAEIIFKAVTPDFGTPTADVIRRVYNRNVKEQAKNGTLMKPLVITLYTDGMPSPGQDVKQTIRDIKKELRGTIYGDHAMLYQIVQTGKVTSVNDWFEELDTDEDKDAYGRPKEPNDGVGDVIDCVSNYEIELDQVLKKNPGAEWFDVPFYKMKCRSGVLIKALDKTDEVSVGSIFNGIGKMLIG